MYDFDRLCQVANLPMHSTMQSLKNRKSDATKLLKAVLLLFGYFTVAVLSTPTFYALFKKIREGFAFNVILKVVPYYAASKD